MNETLTATLQRIIAEAQNRAAYDELRNHGITRKASCAKCDGTGWELVTSGRVTTAGGHEVEASEACPVARRCPSGCAPPVPNNRKAPKRNHEAL